MIFYQMALEDINKSQFVEMLYPSLLAQHHNENIRIGETGYVL